MYKRQHCANGIYFLDGHFEPKKVFCNNRLSVSYNPAAPKPLRWLQFLSELLEEDDILTLQEYLGYCLICLLYTSHPLDQLRRVAAGLYRRYILHGSVSQGHPASILFRQAGITGEKVPKGSSISAGRPFLFCGIERLRKLEHSILELFQDVYKRQH